MEGSGTEPDMMAPLGAHFGAYSDIWIASGNEVSHPPEWEHMDQVLPVPSMSVSTASGLLVFVLALAMEEQRLLFFQSW